MPRGKPRQPRIPTTVHRTHRISLKADRILNDQVKRTGTPSNKILDDWIVATWAALSGESGALPALRAKLEAAAAEHAAATRAQALKEVTAAATAKANERMARLIAAKRKAG